MVAAFREAIGSIAADFQEAWQEVVDEGQYRFDKEFGKVMAQHPELYAELRKTFRQARRSLEKQLAPLRK